MLVQKKAEMCCSVLCGKLWTDQEAFSSDGRSHLLATLCSSCWSQRVQGQMGAAPGRQGERSHSMPGIAGPRHQPAV